MNRLAARADKAFEESVTELEKKIMAGAGSDDAESVAGDIIIRNILRAMKPTIIKGLVYCENHGIRGNEVERQVCESLVAIIWANRPRLPAEWFQWPPDELQRFLGRHVATMGLWLR